MPCGCGGSKQPVERRAQQQQRQGRRQAQIARQQQLKKSGGPGTPGYTWNGPGK